jgi:hypothetical protein
LLRYAIDEDVSTKFSIGEGILDVVKFYINPEIYAKEKGVGAEYEHVNAEFERQSHIGKHLGKAVPSKEMQEVINEFHEWAGNPEKTKKGVVRIEGSLDHPMIKEENSEEGLFIVG